ncbi:MULTISPECIES: DUF2087 domain-containing protein [Actinosynnema]|uniref:DUF2087 domain-containing protein n=1 Tax=Actinosynnema TaxID=40566 RepID=UPI0020A42AB0|nr:DUF2087 domain-containing protein [Actinosynnema pretiosum]
MPVTEPETEAVTEDHPPSCGDLVGLLAEPARRSAFAALVLGAGTVDAVAEMSGLARKDAAQALLRLVDGRLAVLVDGRYALVEEAFRVAVRTEARLGGRGGGGGGAGAYFRRGRLTAVPGDAGVRSKVLAVVADSFAAGEVYSEAKVNALCGEWFDDWVTLRRALVDEGLLTRSRVGDSYERA